MRCTLCSAEQQQQQKTLIHWENYKQIAQKLNVLFNNENLIVFHFYLVDVNEDIADRFVSFAFYVSSVAVLN